MKEEEIIEALKKESKEFSRLYKEHRDMDSQLLEYNKKTYLTPEEEIEVQRIKKEKLYKKDKIMELIRGYKNNIQQCKTTK